MSTLCAGDGRSSTVTSPNRGRSAPTRRSLPTCPAARRCHRRRGPSRPAPVIEKYTGVLAAADVFTASTTFWVMESIRLDFGYASYVCTPEEDAQGTSSWAPGAQARSNGRGAADAGHDRLHPGPVD